MSDDTAATAVKYAVNKYAKTTLLLIDHRQVLVDIRVILADLVHSTVFCQSL